MIVPDYIIISAVTITYTVGLLILVRILSDYGVSHAHTLERK